MKEQVWTVKFEVTSEVKTEEQVTEMAKKNQGSALYNYVRVFKETNPGDDNKASGTQTGNSGFWLKM